MAIVQISKIQVRTGAHSDLPQLDIGELGFATDTKTVHIGNDPIMDPPVGHQPTLTQILTDSPDCDINASQIKGILTIPVIQNFKLGGGTNGQYLQTDGNGTVSWAAAGGGGSGSPGGVSGQIQFNDGVGFAGDNGLTYDSTNSILNVSGNINAANISGTLLTASQTNITRVGTLANLTTVANGNINLGGELIITNQNQHGGDNYAGMITFTSTISGVTNPNKFIRLDNSGNLQILNSNYGNPPIFNLTDSGNLSAPYFVGDGRYLTNVKAANVDTLHLLTVDGNINFIGASNVSLGDISNLHIGGGTNGQVLKTDGNGGLSWTTVTANGNSVSTYGNTDVDLRIASYTGNVAKAVYAYSVDAVNVSGTVSLANTATKAGTVTTNAQPNITSVGTLTSLTVNSAISTGTVTATGNISGLRFTGNGYYLTGVNGANVINYVPNATNANYAANANYAVSAGSFLGPIDWNNVTNKPTRTPLTVTTASLVNNGNANANISGYKGYALYGIQTSANAWVTVYSSANSRISDASRTSTTDPTPNSGVIAEVITTSTNPVYFTPAIIGFNTDDVVNSNIYVKIQNQSGSNTVITTTITVLPLEYY